jgi:hypothetical protein
MDQRARDPRPGVEVPRPVGEHRLRAQRDVLQVAARQRRSHSEAVTRVVVDEVRVRQMRVPGIDGRRQVVDLVRDPGAAVGIARHGPEMDRRQAPELRRDQARHQHRAGKPPALHVVAVEPHVRLHGDPALKRMPVARVLARPERLGEAAGVRRKVDHDPARQAARRRVERAARVVRNGLDLDVQACPHHGGLERAENAGLDRGGRTNLPEVARAPFGHVRRPGVEPPELGRAPHGRHDVLHVRRQCAGRAGAEGTGWAGPAEPRRVLLRIPAERQEPGVDPSALEREPSPDEGGQDPVAPARPCVRRLPGHGRQRQVDRVHAVLGRPICDRDGTRRRAPGEHQVESPDPEGRRPRDAQRCDPRRPPRDVLAADAPVKAELRREEADSGVLQVAVDPVEQAARVARLDADPVVLCDKRVSVALRRRATGLAQRRRHVGAGSCDHQAVGQRAVRLRRPRGLTRADRHRTQVCARLGAREADRRRRLPGRRPPEVAHPRSCRNRLRRGYVDAGSASPAAASEQHAGGHPQAHDRDEPECRKSAPEQDPRPVHSPHAKSAAFAFCKEHGHAVRRRPPLGARSHPAGVNSGARAHGRIRIRVTEDWPVVAARPAQRPHVRAPAARTIGPWRSGFWCFGWSSA